MVSTRNKGLGTHSHVLELLRDIHESNEYADQDEYTTPSAKRMKISGQMAELSAFSEDTTNLIKATTVPPSVPPDDWYNEIAPKIAAALASYSSENMIESSSMRALWSLIVRIVPQSKLVCEVETPWTLKNSPTQGFSSSTTALIKKFKPEFILLVAHCDLADPKGTKEVYAVPHFYTVLINTKKQKVYTFDTLNDSEAENRAKRAKINLDRIFRGQSVNKLLKSPNNLCRVETLSQNNSWTCGYWTACIPYLLFRKPKTFLQIIENNEFDQKATLDSFMKIASDYAGMTVSLRKHLPGIPKRPKKDCQQRPESSAEASGSCFVHVGGPPPKPSSTESSEDDCHKAKGKGVKRKPPIKHPRDDTDDAATKYGHLLNLDRGLVPTIGNARAIRYRQGLSTTPNKWVTDTWDDVANRPQPVMPHGWPGWDEYTSLVNKVDKDIEAAKPGAKELRRALAIKRGRDNELTELDESGKEKPQ